MKLSLNVDTKTLNSYIERTIVNVRRTATRWVREEAESLQRDSLEQVPKDTETLANSSYVEEQSDGSFVVGYGRGGTNPKSHAPAANYMVKIHEDMSLNHPNGKAKFLEDPAREHGATLEAKAAKAMRDAMR